MKDDKLRGHELQEAVAEAHDRLFTGPVPRRGPEPVTDEEIEEAVATLFGGPPAGRVPTGGER